MLSWLPGAQIVPASTPGGAYDPSFPWRIVLHTTEGPSIESAAAAYRSSTSWPHATVDPGRRQIVQHLAFDVAARSLMHPPGTPPTNGARAIQIEIVGFAASIGDLPADQVQWLGQAVLAPIATALGVPLRAPEQWPAYPASYGVGASQRMTRDQWRAFAGICAHMHVPENDHGDTGAFSITAALDAAAGHAGQEDDMPKSVLVVDSHGWVWTLTPGALHLGRAHVPGPDDLAHILGLDKFTGGAWLASETIQSWPDARVAAYPDVAPQAVKVAISAEDAAAIAQQVADLAKLTPAEIDQLVKAFGSKLTG